MKSVVRAPLCWSLFAFLWPVLVLMEKVGNKAISSDDDDQNQLPKPYPLSFQIDFATNLTDDTVESSTWPITGKLYYDWSIRKQRIDHGAGSYECQHFYNTDKACSLIFNHVGMYRLVDDDDKEVPCCLDLPGVGTPPPDWAQQANGTFNGVQLDQVSGLVAFQWTFDRLQPPLPAAAIRILSSSLSNRSAFHTVREVALGPYAGRPLTFTFPGLAQGRQDCHFDVKSMLVGPQKSSTIFDIPNDCRNRLCQEEAVKIAIV